MTKISRARLSIKYEIEMAKITYINKKQSTKEY